MIPGPRTPAIVTGGASGLGAASARALRASGAPVALWDIDTDRGPALAREIGAEFIETDVTDAASVDAALAAFAPPRICLCCAGIAPGARTVGRDGAPHDAALFAHTVAINLTGTFLTASRAAAAMTALPPLGDADAARGVIVTTASIAAYEGQIGQIAYAATKGAVAAMTLPMARDLAKSGIRVVSLAPGLFKTPMVAGLPQEVQDSLGAAVPFPPRLGAPEEFAAMVLQIVENPMLNGSVIRLDGAIRLGPK
ncbi:MAG: SDR family NAD(P)-dependent oxidoreductase [Pseudomonadota bacterium]